MIVCPACEGYGTDASQSVVLTMTDIDEWAGPDADDRATFVADLAAMTPACPLCRGRNVVPEAVAEEWEASQWDRWEMEAERAAERAAGC